MRLKLVLIVTTVFLLVAAAALAVHLTRPRVHVGGASGERVALDAVDHSAYDALLQKYVNDEGLVAYRRWKNTPADVQALDDYLGRLGSVDLSAPATDDARLAFWINAYNALTIKGILLRYPLGSIKDIVSYVPGGYNVWRDLLLRVDGKDYSLENIEHDILRRMGEPRIHFALVCASKGCPPLRNRAYSAAEVRSQLTDNARRFFTRPGNFEADADDKTIRVSELLDWFGSDFAETPAERLRVLQPYFPGEKNLTWLSDPSVILVPDLKYDWSLNAQLEASR
jgi:hypothetical protein